MDVRYLILSLFFLVSCMPTANVSKGNLSNSETTGGSTTSGTTGGSTSPTNLTWNYLGQLVTAITINVSNLNNAYIVGTPVETYLALENNFVDANYCFVSTYSIGGISYELRSRGLPVTYYDFKAKRNVTNIRIDFQDVTNSSDFCNRTVRIKNSTGDYIVDTATPPSSRIKYDPSLICPTCTSMLIATKVRLFKVESTTLDQVPLNYVDTSILYLQVDPNNTATGDTGSCSNSVCRARGFDCCLDNQCVKDGGVKPAAATTYPALLSTAEAERLQNPLAYLNYPQLYYICGSSVPTGGSGGGTTSGTTSGSTGGYDEAFLQLKKDYLCVEHLKTQATTSPFHNEILSKTYTAATDCLTASSDSSQTFYFQNVMKRLYTTCGCNRTVLSEMIANCPAYEYRVTTIDTQGQPIRIDCYTPPVDAGSIPAEQSVSVSSRSAPHRFFDASGVEKTPQSATSQEGDIFEYMDDGKVLPLQQELSMNAILGQMSVTLDKALPAKEVPVQLDQVYFISTTSGYYTPCPSCAKDSWLNAFTAFPSTSMGAGLQAVGHTTERDMFSTNTTAGNYEDTIFGRACWLPPTMIPYSHSAKASTQEQRLNRLKTQATFFVNGYQRDWFGFNKGAMIGSFDGVTWFAIGKGRIVKSSSKKLYLAINAPFADLAASTMHVVRVASYDGITQAAQVDYDPEYHQSHPYQNEAGNCQKYHMCSTDTDCITKLGWEYACADVKDLRTNWPSFDSNAAELAATSTSKSLDQILQQKKYPSATTKRCVYRGAGSLCHTNSGGIASTDLNKRKLLTCAPNFYCANMSSAGVHNTKVARYAAALEELPVSRNHFFGKDANILGRPHDYLGTGSLNTAVRSTVIDNVSVFESTLASNVGLCQPGKALPGPTNSLALSNPFTQHMSADSQRRSDFISQIGSCNSGLFNNDYRHTSCPVIGTDGNYQSFATATLDSTVYATKASGQNSCGLESLLPTASLSASADTLLSSSPFRSIESKPLNSQIIVDPTLVRDACYRRAGAVCHTDLDCSPNKMHASQVDYFSTSFFGNLAEKNYWSEYLVCGQTDPKPMSSDTEAFKNYDMSLNRCCREVGKDITTYTADIPTRTQAGYYDAATIALKMTTNTGKAPNDARRYSRLATVEGIGTLTEKPPLSAYHERSGTNTLSDNPTYDAKTNVKSPHQWKTLGEANSESCCGGGWVRKFSDGSNDWTRKDRLLYDVTNFRCINSRTPLITNIEDVAAAYGASSSVAQSLVNLDYGDYCKDGTNTNGACAQFSILDSFHDVWPDPTATPHSAVVQINTIKPSYASTNPDYFFKPRSADGDSAVVIDWNSTAVTARRNIAIRVPSYVPKTGFEDGTDDVLVDIFAINDAGQSLQCVHYTDDTELSEPTTPTDLTNSVPTTPVATACGGAGIGCCYYSYDSSSRILKMWMNGLAAGSAKFDKKKVGLAFTAKSAGNQAGITRSKPGSTAYYLKRLGLMELSGVPQITFEALTCNDNANRVVPGLYQPKIKTTTDFLATDFSFLYNYAAKKADGSATLPEDKMFTNMHGLAQEPVFSANDFKCCSPLGKVVTDTTKCCSGAGVAYGTNGTRFTCALPEGTDLMVYFNRFISNEGRGVDQPGGGLVDADFDISTGEPLLSSAVNDKIRALGQAYCSSGTVRQGGAFGSFEPEPQGSETNLTSKIYNMVDSSRDIGQVSNAGSTVQTGYQAFMDGFRWNHHLYCDYGEQ